MPNPLRRFGMVMYKEHRTLRPCTESLNDEI